MPTPTRGRALATLFTVAWSGNVKKTDAARTKTRTRWLGGGGDAEVIITEITANLFLLAAFHNRIPKLFIYQADQFEKAVLYYF